MIKSIYFWWNEFRSIVSFEESQINTTCVDKMAIGDNVTCYLAASLFGLKWLEEDREDPKSENNLPPHWFHGCSYHVAVPPGLKTLNKVVFKRHRTRKKPYKYIFAFRELCKAPGIIEILSSNNSSFYINKTWYIVFDECSKDSFQTLI